MSVQYKSYVSLMLSGVYLGHMAKSWINIDFTNLTELNYGCGSVSRAFSIYIFCIHTKCYQGRQCEIKESGMHMSIA